MSTVPRPFAYDSNPQAIYHTEHDPFLQTRELERPSYDLSANAGNLHRASSMNFRVEDLRDVGDTLLGMRIVGDTDLPQASLYLVRGGDLVWAPADHSASNVPASIIGPSANSIVLAQGMPASFTVPQTLSADLTLSAIRYYLGEDSVTGELVLARSAVHTSAITLVIYELY